MSIRLWHILTITMILCLAGIGLATLLVANHFQYVGTDFCSVNPFISCEKVNTGPWSKIIGIPWALIGFIGFVTLFIMAYLQQYYPRIDKNEHIMPMMVVVTWIGTFFVVYLNYLEFFEIHQVCLLCAITHVIMIVILILINWWFFIGRHNALSNEQVEITDISKDST